MKSLKYLLLGLLSAVAIQASAYAVDAPAFASAPPNAIRLISTGAMRGPLETILPQAEKAIGRPIVAEWGAARGKSKDMIMAGQDFEVALLLPDVDADILKAGKIKPGSWEIARSLIGIGIRGDVPEDINLKTNAGIRRAFINAKGVNYVPNGAALPTVHKIISTLQLQDKISDISAISGIRELHSGEYEIYIFPLSEIISNKALTNMGVVIPALQVPIDITATIGTNARDEASAKALIDFLRGRAIDPTLEPNGMIKGRHNAVKH